MGRPKVDYDRTSIPAGYDRAREHGPEVLALWMQQAKGATQDHGEVRRILDLGCGTGRFTRGLSESFGAEVVAIDPSVAMLEQARAKAGDTGKVAFGMGRGEQLPIRDGSIDLVFISMVFHHFAEPSRVAEECRRVLRAGGAVFLRGGSTDRVDSYPYVPFFPESIPLLYEALPSCAEVRATFEEAGFETVREDIALQQIAASHAEYLAKLEAGGDSVLARLDPTYLAQGLARLRSHCVDVDPKPVVEPIDFFVFV